MQYYIAAGRQQQANIMHACSRLALSPC